VSFVAGEFLEEWVIAEFTLVKEIDPSFPMPLSASVSLGGDTV
jgi:hypothetical protein